MLKEAGKFLLSSKTMLLIIVVTLLVAFLLVLATIAYNSGWEVPYVNDFLDFVKWGLGFGTARNTISDGIAPRVPQAVGANRDPSVSIQSPQSMSMATSAPAVVDAPVSTEGAGPPQPRVTPGS